ncbi:MAG: hypothetical protein AAFR20_01455 [Pseudomonadota bacterium]
MAKIFEVRSISHDGKPHYWGAKHTIEEAQALLNERFGGDHKEWAERHHQRWWIEEIDTTGAFQLPSLPSPREMFRTRETYIEAEDTLDIEVLNQANQVVARYSRNYPSLMSTFEPFRQGDKLFALISTDYTASSVLDLATGKIIASEEPHTNGFCPVGFYVPDWWDVNDGSILPGSTRWKADLECPSGDFGFVWGCIWGDDSSWKIQHLDLTNIQSGEIKRDERFGYIELASDLELHPKEFIECNFYGGKAIVRLRTYQSFNLHTGEKLDPLG